MKKMTLFLTLVLLAGCTADAMRDYTVFGYQIGSQARPDIKTVRVPIFRNTTFFRDIEYELTQAVIKRIEDTTPYKVVNENADAQLTAVIKLGTSHVILQNELNEGRTRDFTLVVEASFVDSRTGQDYFIPTTLLPAMSSAPPPSPQTDVLAPPPGVQPPPATLKPRLFARNTMYSQELGQSFALAKQKVIDELAIAIVNSMEKTW
ncbi:MAG: LptE family protein [Planctomycetia bacterium]|nr:LptE family protein [Planctomycetia bacterium]